MTRIRYKSIIDFEILTKLSRSSQGSYGVVVDAVRLSDGKEFVMKFFGYTKNKPDISWILREIDNLRALEGIQGIAQIEATFTDNADGYISKMIPKKFRRKYPIIVMEKLAGGDLFERILTTKFSERDASAIFSTFMTALSQIHNDRDMINIDLKTENLVFSGSSSTGEIVKIIDFGMAVSLWDRSEHFEDKIVGTAAFLSPETIIHYERYGQAVYTRASDIWQAGCILFMILAAQYPFGSENTHTPQQLIQNIKAKRISDISTTGLNLSNEAIDLLNKIFDLDPNQRITARDILNHPWIVNNAQLPEIDLGEVYKNRLKSWSCRKRFRRLLNRNNLGSRARQHALQAVLSLNPQALLHNINNKSSVSPTAATTVGGIVGGINDRYMYDASNRNYIVRSNSSCDYNPTAATATNSHAEGTALDTATDSHSIVGPPHTLNSSNFVITNAGIGVLKSAFVNYIFTQHQPQQQQSQQQQYTIETALQHNGIDFDAFHLVVLTANFPNFATRAVFNIFDWNHTNTVDYLEFLFTLSSFRNDVDWTDAGSVAKLYYDIFDVAQVGPTTTVQSAVMNDSNTNTNNNNITISTTSKPTTDNTNSRTISVDLLVMVLSKLLIESEYGVTTTAAAGATANTTLDIHNEGLHIDTSFVTETVTADDSCGDTIAPLSSGRRRNNNINNNNRSNSINGTATVGRRRGSSTASANVINRYIDETTTTSTTTSSSEKHVPNTVRFKTSAVATSTAPTMIATPSLLITATTTTINGSTTVSPTSPAAIVPTTATEESEQLSMSSIFDIVQCIDTDGDGEITFKEFEAFFHAILRLKSMSMSMTNNNGTAGSSIMSLSLASLAPH